MRQTTSITSTATSIVVIREAYESFLTTQEREITISYCEGPFLTVNPRATLVTSNDVDDWLRFQTLAAKWRSQRGAMSSITEAALCPAYQSIIGMGALAVPFILAELKAEKNEPDQWFWALKAITGDDPVRGEDRGDFAAMAKAWLLWGRRNGYAW